MSIILYFNVKSISNGLLVDHPSFPSFFLTCISMLNFVTYPTLVGWWQFKQCKIYTVEHDAFSVKLFNHSHEADYMSTAKLISFCKFWIYRISVKTKAPHDNMFLMRYLACFDSFGFKYVNWIYALCKK